LRARKTKRYGQRVPIVSYYDFKQALQFQKPKTKGRQIWPPPWAAKGPATPLFVNVTYSTLLANHWQQSTEDKQANKQETEKRRTKLKISNTCMISNNKHLSKWFGDIMYFLVWLFYCILLLLWIRVQFTFTRYSTKPNHLLVFLRT